MSGTLDCETSSESRSPDQSTFSISSTSKIPSSSKLLPGDRQSASEPSSRYVSPVRTASKLGTRLDTDTICDVESLGGMSEKKDSDLPSKDNPELQTSSVHVTPTRSGGTFGPESKGIELKPTSAIRVEEIRLEEPSTSRTEQNLEGTPERSVKHELPPAQDPEPTPPERHDAGPSRNEPPPPPQIQMRTVFCLTCAARKYACIVCVLSLVLLFLVSVIITIIVVSLSPAAKTNSTVEFNVTSGNETEL